VYTVIQTNGDEVDEHVYSQTSDTNKRSMFIGQTKVPGNWYVPGYINSGHRFCGMILRFFYFLAKLILLLSVDEWIEFMD